MISSGHYATNAIKSQMNRLNDEWQNLSRLLEKRSNILTASLQFHQKADEVTDNLQEKKKENHSFVSVSRSSTYLETFMFSQ